MALLRSRFVFAGAPAVFRRDFLTDFLGQVALKKDLASVVALSNRQRHAEGDICRPIRRIFEWIVEREVKTLKTLNSRKELSVRFHGAGGGGRTHMTSEGRGILSPVRLPVPPLQPDAGTS
jgi:hypothetical protein